jgi:hypothetical protein
MTKIISPRPGWLRLLWSEPPPASVMCALEAAADIPGCQLNTLSFDASPTTMMLPEVHEIFGDACFEPSTWSNYNTASLFAPLRPLYAHQGEASVFILDSGGGALLADEMGLGKTAAAIVAAETRRRALHGYNVPQRPGVIVGPLVARAVWQRELLALGAIERPEDFCAIVSQDLDDASFRKNAQWYFVHYDVAKFWWSRIGQLKPAVAIVDEAHYVINGRAQRSVATGMIALPAPFRIVLTGTPLEKKPSDLWWPLTLACGPRSWGGPLDFRKRYCGAVQGEFAGHVDGEPTHVDELKLRMKHVFLRRTVEQAGFDMPPLTRTLVPARMTDPEEYRELASKVSVRDIVAAVMVGNVEQVLPVYSRLRALTSRGKLDATVAQVETLLAQECSVVVFCWSRETVRAIYSRVRGSKFRATGEDALEDRQAAVDAFQAQARPSVMVATYGALREGVTLHRARVVVMHDLDLSISSMLQAEKRVHRIGQKRACQSLWMLAEDSVDTLIAPILQGKAELLRSFFDTDVLPELSPSAEQSEQDVGAAVDRALEAWGGGS